jgi:hypothetical protein
LVVVVALSAMPARAVLLYQTAMRNTWAPSGTLLNSGWQYEGRWGAFLGTPISSRHFITAEHVGGAVGQAFTYHGKVYTAKAKYDDPNSDLRIWLVDRPFTDAYAPIYRGSGEVGRQAMIIGRGTQRGTEVRVNYQLKGWRWGTSDGLTSWGTNQVSGLVNGGAGIGTVLRLNFDATGGRNEGTLTGGDSGGGAFVYDNGAWKLAGVNFSAKGPYSLTGASGSAFNASIFDEGALYVGSDSYRWYQPDGAVNVPGGSYLSRVSAEQSWIDSITRPALIARATTSLQSSALTSSAVPEPGAAIALTVVVAGTCLRRRRR